MAGRTRVPRAKRITLFRRIFFDEGTQRTLTVWGARSGNIRTVGHDEPDKAIRTVAQILARDP